MPIYDFRCDRCECEEDDVYATVSSMRAGLPCDFEDCDGTLRRRFTTGHGGFVGPTDTNPLKIGGRSFTSSSELRAWEKANPDLRPMDKDGPEFRKHKDKARERAEVAAKKKGFRDWDHKVAHDKERKRKGQLRKRQKPLIRFTP